MLLAYGVIYTVSACYRVEDDHAYVVLEPLYYDTDRVEKCHLSIWQVNFLDQRHQSLKCCRRIREEVVGVEFPLIGDILEASACSHSYDLVVQWVACIEQVLVDLIDNGLLLLSDFDGYPLGNDDSDTTANDVEAGLLFGHLNYKRLLEEGVEVKLIVQDVGGKTNGGVDGVLEQNVFIVRCCHRQYAYGLLGQ